MTEPWTLTSCRGIAINPHINYTLVHTKSKETYIISTNRFEAHRDLFKKKLAGESYMRFMGEDFKKLEIEDLFSSRTINICLDHSIKAKSGSGINPVCPAHFIDDIKLAQVKEQYFD